VDPYYNHYLRCVEYFGNRLKLSYEEYRNVVAVIVGLYRKYFRNVGPGRSQTVLDNIGKFERLIYLYTNKTFPTQSVNCGQG
ncbi:MAG: hypothetical protein U9N45_07400, partial [Gemmatimonadota bacterium]|nr:hypothetical protein [Gemmatimonadota bacterium]